MSKNQPQKSVPNVIRFTSNGFDLNRLAFWFAIIVKCPPAGKMLGETIPKIGKKIRTLFRVLDRRLRNQIRLSFKAALKRLRRGADSSRLYPTQPTSKFFIVEKFLPKCSIKVYCLVLHTPCISILFDKSVSDRARAQVAQWDSSIIKTTNTIATNSMLSN